jgi:hypothetical protein
MPWQYILNPKVVIQIGNITFYFPTGLRTVLSERFGEDSVIGK